MRKQIKRYLADIAGISLIVLGLLVGWLPGPGGIPLVLGGLGLLAIHNKWAENILLKMRNTSTDFAKIIFPASKKLRVIHDVLAILLMVCGVWLVTALPNKILALVGVSLIMIGLSEFLFNRGRINKLNRLALRLAKPFVTFYKKLFRG